MRPAAPNSSRSGARTPERGTPLGGAEIYQQPVTSLGGSEQRTERVSPCPVCGCREARPRLEVQGFAARVQVCCGCGLGRLYPVPDREALRALYPDAYYGEPGTKFQPLVEWLVRWVGARHSAFLSRGLRPGARILDVGCGRGVVLGALADRGFEVHGVEISPEATRGADPRAEIRIAYRLADAGYAEAFFDEVLIWHVLEHVDDPRGILEEVHRILRPGGRLVVAVPNFSSLQARWAGAAWFHLDLPRHLFHFPLAALRALLTDVGFEIASEHHFSLRQNPFGWIQSFLNLFPRMPRNALYTLLHRRAPGQPPPFDARTRRWLWLWLLLGSPLALAMTVCGTLLRSAATVHVVSRRLPAGPPGVSNQSPAGASV